MNDSGPPVAPRLAFYKLEPERVLVVHDEGDFDLGRLELKVGGGLAGHNGLRSIAQQLGTRTSCACASASAARSAATRDRSPTRCSRTSSPTRTPEAIVARAADGVERSRRRRRADAQASDQPALVLPGRTSGGSSSGGIGVLPRHAPAAARLVNDEVCALPLVGRRLDDGEVLRVNFDGETGPAVAGGVEGNLRAGRRRAGEGHGRAVERAELHGRCRRRGRVPARTGLRTRSRPPRCMRSRRASENLPDCNHPLERCDRRRPVIVRCRPSAADAVQRLQLVVAQSCPVAGRASPCQPPPARVSFAVALWQDQTPVSSSATR